MSLVGDGVLAVSQGVPQLDGPITRARNDLPVVCGKGYGENIVGVSDESAGGDTGREFPQTKSLVPRSRKSVCTVRGNDLKYPYQPLFQSCHPFPHTQSETMCEWPCKLRFG